MKCRRAARWLAAGVALAAVLAVGPARAADAKKWTEMPLGTTVPDFALPDVDGKQVKLSDYKDKVVFVVFFAHW